MPKRAVVERSRRGLSLDVSVGVHILLVVEQSSLENQSRGCAKTPILRVYCPIIVLEWGCQREGNERCGEYAPFNATNQTSNTLDTRHYQVPTADYPQYKVYQYYCYIVLILIARCSERLLCSLKLYYKYSPHPMISQVPIRTTEGTFGQRR